MEKEICQRWIKHLSRRIPIIPNILSVIFGFSALIIYLAFMFFEEIDDFKFNVYNFMQVLFFCILLTYLLIFNKYLLNKIEKILLEFKLIPENGNYKKDMMIKLEKILYNYADLYIIIFLVMGSFLIIDYLIINYFNNLRFLNTLLNIYNYFLFIFMLYLISVTLWLILKISLILDIFGMKPYRYIIEIDPFNADRIGGLSDIRNSIMKILLYYSLGISLAILSYADPSLEAIIYEVTALALLLLAGVILLFRALQNLQQPFLARIIKDLEDINIQYQIQYKNLTRIISDLHEKDDALTSVTKRIEALNGERAEREKLLNENKNKYSYSAAIISATALITPVLALFEKMNDFGISRYILEILKLR